MTGHDKLDQFIAGWRARINRASLLRRSCIATFLAAVGVLAVAGGFVLAGYAVGRWWLIVPLAGAGAGLTLWHMVRRCSPARAVRDADDTFQLKDGLVSATVFTAQGKCDGVYALQSEHTTRMVSKVDTNVRRFRAPWMLVCLVGAMFIASGWLCTLDDSPRVAAMKLAKLEVQAKTDEINKHMKELVKEMASTLSEPEKKLFEKSRLAKLVEQLAKTGNRKDAMRQYTDIEKKIRDFSARLATKSDEKYATRMAKQLKNGKETKELAKSLSDKEYSKAADELKEMSRKTNEEKLSDIRTRLDKLSKVSKGIDKASADSEDSESPLKDSADDLSESTQLTEQELAEAERQECELGKCDAGQMAELAETLDDSDAKLIFLSDALDDLDAKRKFLLRLDEMRKNLGECQRYLLSRSRTLAKKKGIGSSKDGRMANKTSEKTDKTLGTKVDPLRGAGPSEVAVQDASSGAGVARIRGRSRQAGFQRQVESLVRRQDVPADLKDGVKNYFESIHEKRTK